MSVDVTVSIEIQRPAAEVFDYVSNFEHNPVWQGGMQSARVTSEPPLRVGSTYVQVAKFLGRRIDTRFEVTGLEPGRAVSIASTSGTFAIQVTRRVEPTGDDRCAVTAHVRGQPTGFFKLFGGLMDGMVRKSVQKDYAELKRILQS